MSSDLDLFWNMSIPEEVFGLAMQRRDTDELDESDIVYCHYLTSLYHLIKSNSPNKLVTINVDMEVLQKTLNYKKMSKYFDNAIDCSLAVEVVNYVYENVIFQDEGVPSCFEDLCKYKNGNCLNVFKWLWIKLFPYQSQEDILATLDNENNKGVALDLARVSVYGYRYILEKNSNIVCHRFNEKRVRARQGSDNYKFCTSRMGAIGNYVNRYKELYNQNMGSDVHIAEYDINILNTLCPDCDIQDALKFAVDESRKVLPTVLTDNLSKKALIVLFPYLSGRKRVSDNSACYDILDSSYMKASADLYMNLSRKDFMAIDENLGDITDVLSLVGKELLLLCNRFSGKVSDISVVNKCYLYAMMRYKYNNQK